MLDVSLPDGSGFDFCKRVRLTSKVPIIFLTASDEETSIIMGLDIGGDDYITKPFKLGVLVSRINALLRRANSFQAADTELQSNGIKVLLLQGSFKSGSCGFDCRGIQATVLVYEKPKHGADKGTNFR